MTTFSHRWWASGLLFLVMAVGVARIAAAQDDPAAQFSASSNPVAVSDGDWSYGYENFPLPNSFNSLPAPVPVGSLDTWQTFSFGQVGVFHNGTNAPQPYVVDSVDNAVCQPGEIGMHPGPNDQYGVVQFTATTPGFYKIVGTFEGLDLGGATNTDVSLLWDNLPFISGTVIGDGPGSDVPLSAGPFFLNVGDTLAYAVGGSPFEGSTGLVPGSAFVAAVAIPEPSTFILLGLGIAGVFGHTFRRRLLRKSAAE